MHRLNIIAVLFVVITISSAANLLLNKRPGGRFKKQICVDNMCNAVPRYPKGKIRRLASNNNTFTTMFGRVIEPQIKLAQRWNDDSSNMCPTTRITLTPRTAKNIKGEQKMIVNIDDHIQTVIAERCDDKAQCFQDGMMSPEQGDNLECQTQYVNIRLVVYNKDGSMAVEHFPVAAGCYCSYKETPGRSLTTCNHI